MSIGVYKITNTITNDFYIGSSSNNISMRFRRHKSDLTNNKHPNKHLQASYNKYGKDSFNFEIIELCEAYKCIEREQYYIDTLKPIYNKAPIAGSSRGRKASEETKEKMSLAQKKRDHSHLKGNTFRRGSKHTKESLKLMSLKQKGHSATNFRKIKDNLGNEYFSIVEASIITGVKRTTISEALKHKRKTKSGLSFEYVLGDK